MSNTNNQNNTSNNSLSRFVSRIWQNSQQIIKGFSLVTLGIIGYSFLKPASKSTENNNELSATSQSTDLTSSNNGMVGQKSSEPSNIIPHNNFFELSSTVNNIDQTITQNELDINYPEQDKLKITNEFSSNKIHRNIDIENNTQTPIAVEFRINDVTTYNQRYPTIAPLSYGFVVGWQSEGQDSDISGIYGQVLSNRGEKIDLEFPINTFTDNAQTTPYVASQMDDSFLFTWVSMYQDGYLEGVFGQQYDSLRNSVGPEQQINYVWNNAQYYPASACHNDTCLVIWQSNGGEDSTEYFNVFGQAMKNGVKIDDQFFINTPATVDQAWAHIAARDNGYIVTWANYVNPTAEWDIEAQIFDAAFNKVGSSFFVNTFTLGWQYTSKVAVGPDNGFGIVWQSDNQDGSGYSCIGRAYNQAGSALSNEVIINTYMDSDQLYPVITGLSKKMKGYLATWASHEQDGSMFSIQGQLLTKDFIKIGREFQINHFVQDNQQSPALAELSDGNVAVVWESRNQDKSGYGIYGRILIPDITLFGYNFDIPKTYIEDTTYLFDDLIINPMVDADTVNVTLTLSDPTVGSLSIESSRNITSTYNSSQGIWHFYAGGIVDVNNVLSQLKFYPAPNENRSYTIQVDLTDSNNNHTAYSNTLNMIGIPVNDLPILSSNQLTLNQGDTITLSTTNMNASDVDNPLTDLSFFVDKLVQGQFENIKNPGRGITSFSYSQLTNSEIVFIHDNTRFAPTYQISVSDGDLTTSPQSATIDFNAKPELLTNQLNIEGGQTIILTQDNLKASDDHTLEGELVFIVSNINHGQFEIVSAKGTAVMQFTQQQVIDGQVQFVHDGSVQAPGFETSVNDGRVSSSPSPVTVNFVASNSADNTLPIALGVSIGGAALLAGAGIGIWQAKKQQQLRQEREQEPLANAVRTKLRVGNVDDFKSSQGRNYVNFINTLKNELINLGIETEQMLPDEINELAGFISNAIKDTMKENGLKLKKTVIGAIELNTQTLQTYASTIAAKTQEFKNDHLGLNDSGMGLKTINPVNAV